MDSRSVGNKERKTIKMERSEFEALAKDTANTAVQLARAELNLQLERHANAIRKDVRDGMDELKDLIHEKTEGPITGLSREEHAIQHRKLADLLETASNVKREVLKKTAAYLLIGVISAVITNYLGSKDANPAISKEIPTYKIAPKQDNDLDLD